MGFRDAVLRDNLGVFLDPEFFGEARDMEVGGVIYPGVMSVMSQVKEKDRSTGMRDHAQGVYLVSGVLHCRLGDLGGVLPEKGQRIRISREDGFLQPYLVAQSGCDMGMVRLELEEYEE